MYGRMYGRMNGYMNVEGQILIYFMLFCFFNKMLSNGSQTVCGYICLRFAFSFHAFSLNNSYPPYRRTHMITKFSTLSSLTSPPVYCFHIIFAGILWKWTSDFCDQRDETVSLGYSRERLDWTNFVSFVRLRVKIWLWLSFGPTVFSIRFCVWFCCCFSYAATAVICWECYERRVKEWRMNHWQRFLSHTYVWSVDPLNPCAS